MAEIIIILLISWIFIFVLFRTDDLLGFSLAMHYFENIELFDWFSALKYVPSIFVSVLCHLDKALTKSLELVQCLAKNQNRTCYNYLIIDANKFISLMRRRSGMSSSMHSPSWHDYQLFRSCIVYVGKGTNARRDMHFKDAKLIYIGHLDSAMASGQASFISTCWASGGGVYSIQFEGEATAHESLCREAAVIEALGLVNLKNKILGAKFGDMKTWSHEKVRNFGEILIFIAFKNFILRRPPVIKPCDVNVRSGSVRCKKISACKNCGHIIS